MITLAALGFASRRGSAPPQQADAGARNPVLLIHGIHDSAESMGELGRWLTQRGWEVHTLSLVPNDGRAGLDELAEKVAGHIRATFRNDAAIDLVGFSMGGLVCRYYVQRLDGARRIGRFVAISAPNHGSWLAYLSSRPGCVQMRPSSPFLRDLNGDVNALDRVRFTTVWTPLDLVIVPSHSSRMPVGREVKRWILAHPLMVLDRRCFRAVAEALSQ